MLSAAKDSDLRHDVGGQGQALFKKYWLKGQQSVADKAAEVHRRKAGKRTAVVRPGQLQHFLDEPAHLPGHGEDVGGELAAAGLVKVRAVQKLRVGHNDRQGRFQLMGGVRHELPLLLPRLFNRPHGPPGQQPTDKQECGKAQHRDDRAGLQQMGQHRLLTGHIGKDDALPKGGDAAAVPQAVFRQHTDGHIGFIGGGDQRIEKFLVRQVIIAAARGGEVAILVQLQHEKRELDALRRLSQTVRAKRLRRNALQHGNALSFQSRLRKVVHKTEDDAHHHRDDEHIHADEFQPQTPNHSATSRW